MKNTPTLEQRAERILRTQRKIADDLQLIEDDKEALRASAAERKEGFTFEIDGLGQVEVKAPREAELTGTAPQIIVAAYLKLGEAKRKKLVDDGIVEIIEVWKKAAKPSVTVRI
jgi:serine kinase of HPr protein (carbohydrate metabolism regulator)